MDFTSLQTAALLIAVSLVGALVPLHRRWSDRGLHLFVAVSAGIFLGTVFLHLLPHLAGAEGTAGVGRVSAPSMAPWIAALAGLLFLFALEKVWLPSLAGSSAPDPHRSLWRVTWVGLALHSVAEGVALAAVLEQPAARTQLLFSILVHKATESFSLATVMRLANVGGGKAALFLIAFAGLGPLGLLLGGALQTHAGDAAAHAGSIDGILTGFACGTFLYVAACDLLPEVFHGVERPGLKLAAVVTGILATAVTLPRLAWARDFAVDVGQESWAVLLDISPFLLVGFAIAGVLHQFIKAEWLTRHVAKENLRSVTLASLLGAPLPLCSCSVVPVAVSMRRAGASKGATSAFLIATPETGVDSITVSWALLGPFLTVARFVGAIVSAIFTGAAVSWFVRRGYDRAGPGERPAGDTAAIHVHAEAAPRAARPPPRWWTRVLRYAFVEMMDDLAGSLVVGILISGIIAAAIPPSVFENPLARGFPGMLVMLAIGIPTYVCAAASTPIAATLMMKGMSPGAAFVFLLASPATNLGSLVMLTKHLGKRVVIAQVVALSIVTLALGWLVDLVYVRMDVAPAVALGPAGEHAPAWFELASAGVLLALIALAFVRTGGTRSLLDRLRGVPQPTA